VYRGLAVGWFAEGASDPHRACAWLGGGHVALGAGGGGYSEAAGVNGRGQVVGWSLMAGGFSAVMREGRDLIDLSDVTAVPVRPGEPAMFPWSRLVAAGAVDEDGWIAGYGQASNGWSRAFLLRPVVMRAVP
jgi:uncharacterized membrane protein